MALIETRELCRWYGSGETRVKALDNLSLTVEQGEFLAIVGRSGSGKSTLMNILGCLDEPTSGTYLLDGEDVSALDEEALTRVRRRKIGFVFQGFHLIPGLTALENVELPLRYQGVKPRQRRAAAEEALARVGLAHRLSHRPSELSGGQQQRVAIARAIVSRPPLILADEPTGNLDTASGEEVMALLRSLWQQGHTVVLITHDPRIAASYPTFLLEKRKVGPKKT